MFLLKPKAICSLFQYGFIHFIGYRVSKSLRNLISLVWNRLSRDGANTGVHTVPFWSRPEDNSIHSNGTTGPMVSMWPCNFSVKVPSKVITPKRKRKINEYMLLNNEDSVVQTFMMEFRARKTFWYSFGFSNNLLLFLFGLLHCRLLRCYHFYTDLFTNLFSML